VAQQLFESGELCVEVDMFDRLPTPFGLVRNGVAPDHQKIKFVSKVYDKLARRPNYRFFGNVEFGNRMRLADLERHYHQIVLATGAESDRRLGVPGEELEGCWPARMFVAWYNGHPDYSHLQFDLNHRRAVVVGMGNVAADVARILCQPAGELATTDIADYALEALRASAIEEVVILGRRGAAQAAFTIPEIRKLGDIAGVETTTLAEDMELDALSAGVVANDREAARKVEILRSYSGRRQPDKARKLVIRFLASPTEILGDELGGVRAVRLVRNELYAAAGGAMRSRAAGGSEVLETGLVLRSVGYKGVPMAGLPFDERRGAIPHEKGRVIDPTTEETIPGLYVSGWIKRGANGIIGTNKPDAKETVACMLADFADGGILDAPRPDRRAVDELLAGREITDIVSYPSWSRIDEIEMARGKRQGRPRVKFTEREEVARVLREEAPGTAEHEAIGG